MFCMKCGRDLPDDANFCLNCGTPTGRSSAVSAQVYFINLKWHCQPTVFASTNDESIAKMIYEDWKKQASLPELVSMKPSDDAYHVEYNSDKFSDVVFRLNKCKKEIRTMYDAWKQYALVNGWELTEPELRLTGDNQRDTIALNCTYIKKY